MERFLGSQITLKATLTKVAADQVSPFFTRLNDHLAHPFLSSLRDQLVNPFFTRLRARDWLMIMGPYLLY
jgi:hypothetical protein